MAVRALLTAQAVVGAYPVTPLTVGAATLTETAGDASTGHYTPIVDGRTYLIAHNTGAGARTLTITSAIDTYNRLGTITAYSIAAGGISIPFGPFTKLGWGNVGPDIACANPSAAADDIIDTTGAHGLAANDVVRFTTITGGAGLTALTDYYVISTSLGSTTLKVSATRGGSAINFTTDITAGNLVRVGTVAATPIYLWVDVSHAEMKLAVVTAV